MNKLVSLCVLLATVGILAAELAWQQPVTVMNCDNVEYHGGSLLTSDGCHLMLWWQNDNGNPGYKLCLYDQQYQPLWNMPMDIPAPWGVYKMVETSDQAFAMVYSNSAIRVLKISRTGEFLWGPLGITVLGTLWEDITAALVADQNGGVYVSWAGDGNDGQRCAIQHLDASGTITMPATGVIIENMDSWYTDLMIMPDNSVLICWSNLYAVKAQRVNYSGQFMWSQAINVVSDSNYPTGIICAFADDYFALCVEHHNRVDVQRYNYSGVSLWSQPVTAISASGINGWTMRAIPGYDNSIFITAETSNSEYLQKISADGMTHYGAGIDLTMGIGFLDGITQAIPDDDGGCVVVGRLYSYAGDIKAFQVNSTGTVTVYDAVISSNRKEYPSAHRYGNSIGIEWLEQETGRRGIKVQMLDQQFQPQLEADGMELVNGNSGKVRNVQTSARSDGSAVIWQQAELASSHWDLYLQIYTYAGQPVFGDGAIMINRPESSLNGASLVLCYGNLTIVVWGELLGSVFSRRYQIFGPTGNILLPVGGLQIGVNGQAVDWVNVSTYRGDWYMIWSSSNTIWGQKFSGITALWGEGIQITQPHPDITDSVGNIKLDWPWLTWTLDTKPMLVCLDANGVILPGFPAWGMGMPVQNGAASLYKHTFTVCGEYLHVLLGFIEDSNPYWTNFIHTHTMISRQGEYLFSFTELQVESNYNVFIRDGMVCIGDYYYDYVVREYNTSGILTGTHTIPVAAFQNNGWNVLGANYLSNGDLLLLINGYLNNSPTVRHIFITPQWQQDLPVDSVVLTGWGSLPPSVSLLSDRAWIAMAGGRDNQGNNATVFLQGVVIADTPNPDPDPQAPAMLCLDNCSPNPFNPSTSISFSLPLAGKATISVYDLRGRKIATIMDSDMPVGKHSITWNGKDSKGKDMASGVYILHLDAGGKHHSRKVTLMK
jgi:hypothetical protein